MQLLLPSSLSHADFGRALKAFAGVVGKDWVLASDQDRDTYLDAYALGDGSDHPASAAVAPHSTAADFFALYNHLRDSKVPLWMSVPANGWGSVVGNALERGIGYIAYNSAADTDGDGTYTYAAIALDCGERRYFVLGDVARNSAQKVAPGWLTDSNRVRPLRKGSVVERAADLLCPERSRLRTGAIE